MKKHRLLFLFCAVPFLLPGLALAGPVAKVGDWTLDQAEVDASLSGQIHELREEKVQERVLEHLLGLEAKANKIPLEEVMEKLASKGVEPVTDADVTQFINANKARLPSGGQGMEGKVREFLADQAVKKAHAQFQQGLFEKYKAEILLEAPRYVVEGPQDLSRGNPQAPVTIIEFSDFECPYCRKSQPVLKGVEEHYGEKVRFIFRHYPLPFHKKAPKASEAALCAQDQGKFWPFHDALFADETLLTVEKFKELSKTLKMDEKLFADCLDGGQKTSRLQADLAAGRKLGITGTPTFFINGVKLVGAVPLDAFRDAVDAALVEKKK